MQHPAETAELGVGVVGRAALGWEAAGVVLLLMALLPTLAAGTFPDVAAPHFKPYSGVRVSQNSLRRVVVHDQTLGVLEITPGAETRLLSCELIEANRPQDMKEALLSLKDVAIAEYVNFMEMKKIMSECHSLPPPPNLPPPSQTPAPETEARGQGALGVSLLSGIVPGTKWCGTGDIAENYHDLGAESELDSCCRIHDLCPVKVKAFRSRYDLTNLSVYTKSHCDCDSMLYSCLKSVKSPKANLLGQVYFNLLRVPCVEDNNCNSPSCKQRKLFRSARQRF